ncbi:MAG TPA: hypothetical protein VMS86_15410 [Thermoanaerobaculia bacterium]|nr:hypothetical protein [Thermoanaerobaculia bacterium]
MNAGPAPLHIVFDPPSEVFATDASGSFVFPLLHGAQGRIETALYDEVRFVFSIWSPSSQSVIDLDRTYLELRASLDPEEEHWTKLAEVEPVVPAYNSGERFDGWIVLPILASVSAFSIAGSGFQPRSRLQLRASAYFVT